MTLNVKYMYIYTPKTLMVYSQLCPMIKTSSQGTGQCIILLDVT